VSIYYNIFQIALSKTINDYLTGLFIFESQRDLQSLIFHYVIEMLKENKLQVPLQIHVEATRYNFIPDLILGLDDIFVEIEFSKRTTAGAFTQALQNWIRDVEKLKKYKSRKPSSRCFFLAIDESSYHYHARPNLKNSFYPAQYGLTGQLTQLANKSYLLLGEVTGW
jgi:hypothetical protein